MVTQHLQDKAYLLKLLILLNYEAIKLAVLFISLLTIKLDLQLHQLILVHHLIAQM